MSVLYLVRHGETLWNVARRFQGWKNSPLTPLGETQAGVNGDLLARLGVEQLFASPLGRTRQTAGIIAEKTGATTQFDDRLREINVGDWGGLSLEEVSTQFADAWNARLLDPFNHRPPNGESRSDLAERVGPCIDEIVRAGVAGRAIVSHGITTRIILNHVLDLSPETQAKFHVPNDVVYALDFSDSVPVVSHFRRGEGPFVGLFIGEP